MYGNVELDDINEEGNEEEDNVLDWQLPICFMKKRHKEKIEGTTFSPQTWKMKEKMKTVSVNLVLCLNIGVDPPDIVKTNPCARMECWIDPLSLNPQKALELIGNKLQEQYERWQPRARYRHNLDPTVEDVKKLCTSLRRNAKEERVLFHYNGHGVPRPTANGEIWVFNKQYTQYIPLSIYDLQTWMGSPSIYVYDCSNAGLILECFKHFAQQREQEYERASAQGSNPGLPPLVNNCIQLAACGPNELLPMMPDLPADLFTSCLTTPIKVALQWFVSQRMGNLVPGITVDLIEKIPGQLNDRRTPLGELSWIFIAVTDTIAWLTLPIELFQKLFRQDMLVASLFRNYLLAERVMRSYCCTPVTSPKLPPMYHHHMWLAWDLAVDQCLSQLPVIIEDINKYKNSTFFYEQLTAFQVWLAMGREDREPPEQLPVVLQVLLSQVHRLRALDLLGRFLDLGPWAVNLALSVNISPYILRLLRSPTRELRPLLVFILAKILAVDSSFQTDLVQENGHKYFLSVLADGYMPAEHRTTASFVLARIVHDYPAGQEACLKGNMISICLEQLTDPHPLLRQWLALCLGLIWKNCDAARWCGIRDSAPDKISKLLPDPLPDVRAAAVFALGTLIGNTGDRSDHANMIDQSVATTLTTMLANEGSPLVRKELVVALYSHIMQFENAFIGVAVQFMDDSSLHDSSGPGPRDPETKKGWILVPQSSDANISANEPSYSKKSSGQTLLHSSRSSISLSSMYGSVSPTDDSHWFRTQIFTSSLHETVYTRVWKAMLNLSMDPHTETADMARKVVNTIAVKAAVNIKPHNGSTSVSTNVSLPSSPNTSDEGASIHPRHSIGEFHRSTSFPSTPEQYLKKQASIPTSLYRPHSVQFSTKRGIFDKGPDVFPTSDDDSDADEDGISMHKHILVRTKFYEWCCGYFAHSLMKPSDDVDPNSAQCLEREGRFLRNTKVRKMSAKLLKEYPISSLDDEIFVTKNPNPPGVLKFHPYHPHLVVADRSGVSVLNYESGIRLNQFDNGNPRTSRICSMDILNAHDVPLLLTGSDDGAVRVWRNYIADSDEKLSLVTAWTALSGMIPSSRGSGSGLVTDWEQQSGMLLASGDVRIIRIWDVHRELKLQDIPTGADSCVTSLACDSLRQSLLVAGLGDGSVRIYDRRQPSNDCRVMTLREHQGWVVKVLIHKRGDGNIISGSVDGDIKFWEPRMATSLKTLPGTVSNLTTLDVHQQADILACGSANQSIKILNLEGEMLSHIRYHEGFMGQRIGPLKCLSFHPYWPYLAAGSTDSYLSIYSSQKPIPVKFDDLGM
ncbi:regulatory-associated protein of mTOR isoform X1 [Hydra vulgaris]|uniref:regulatory-associated protein of mTOR isoform X1 n=1 Tax=Hydra vulgaris TaxID=6087 RepID=UPI000640FC62|nr:unnamed protein product [Hydra vulgaris]XP_047142923.1 regulatory-associated protein of mTOR [Hydra vulgaris]